MKMRSVRETKTEGVPGAPLFQGGKMKRIRMLKNLLTRRGDFRMGKSYEVGDRLGQAPVNWAESWIRTGHAEEDKEKGGAPETKEQKKKRG
jgi:beta-xylosidase